MKVLEPIRIGNLEIKNRMVVSAMVTNYCKPDGNATEKFIAYHERKAQGGWGLIITEDYKINPTAGGFTDLPGLWDDAQIESHRRLTDRVHAAGGKIAAQIYHAGRETSSAVNGEQPIAPSAIKDPTMPEIPRALTIDEIHTLVGQFGDCAKRAKQAGFDAVEIHGAHGYLVGAFLSPFSNKRMDEYGGCLANRARFAVEIIHDIREKCGKDFPIIYRMSTVEYVNGGLDIEETKAIARILEQNGIDCIHCSQGVYASTHTIIPPYIVPKAAYVNNAAEIKSVVSIPVIAVGRINDVQVAESVIASGKADLVTMARASLADPDLPKKAMCGQEDETLRCIGCLQGCSAESSAGRYVRCLVNPITGMEDEYDLTPDEISKKVLVVGGGVAGCEAAIAAGMKGHKVTLIEKSDRLGGQWIPASVPIGKGEFTGFLYWQGLQLKKYDVDVRLNKEADIDLIKEIAPDVLIMATGSQPFVPGIAGKDQEFVVNAHQVLLGKVQCGHKIVVIGGGLVGCETADMLAEQGADVTIIEMMPEIMRDGEASPTMYLKQRFDAYGVKILTSTKLMEIGDKCVKAERDGDNICIEDVDTVIVAVGVRTDTSLLDKLDGLDCKVIKVGDANGVKNGYKGIREGFEAGLSIGKN
jgi:2,4-dienoyl-CoA reductase-like NADH-dependent reductase (Old Yellow Enzyme family)/thioredoxin reductase